MKCIFKVSPKLTLKPTPPVFQARDEAKHVVKKVTKEIMRLFGKKSSLDISSGDTGKKKKKLEKEKEGQWKEFISIF